MLSLPSLVHGSREWHLPLTGPTSLTLCETLITGDSERLTKTMFADPALALWTLSRAASEGIDNLKTPAQLAAWLAPRLLAELRATVGGDSVAELPREQVNKFAALAATSLVLRAHVTQSEAAALLALVHDASSWFETQDLPLPCCLIDSLKAISKPRGGDATVHALRKAQARRSSKSAYQRELAVARRAWLGSHDAAAMLAPLVTKLAQLDELERSFAERLETEKLESLAEFAAGAGHEMNNPLAVISGRAQLFLRSETDPERRRELALINTQAKRVHEMIADLMLFARPPEPVRETCDLVTLVGRVADEVRRKATEQGTTVDMRSSVDSLTLDIDASQLSVALLAVCDNALFALGEGGRIELSIDRQDSSARITIHDDGPGIPAEIRRHAFDPFYSGRQAGRGLGNGLSKCWRIVTNHGGSIDVRDNDGAGTAIVIDLPLFAELTSAAGRRGRDAGGR